MLEISGKTNLLEQDNYKYSLQDVAEPNLYRDFYTYEDVPRVAFNHRRVPMGMPKDIWITDTSLRDGQQSVEPYTVDQIVNLYKLMSKLGGPYGIIRQTEFFVYSKKDREAIEKCQALGLKFPEITTWIRASKEDFKLVRDLGIRETGILVSCSDYHIFKKLKKTRGEAMKMYLEAVSEAFEDGREFVKEFFHKGGLLSASFQMHHTQARDEGPARDFPSGQDARAKAYRVYVEPAATPPRRKRSGGVICSWEPGRLYRPYRAAEPSGWLPCRLPADGFPGTR